MNLPFLCMIPFLAAAIANHARIGPSACGYRARNSLSVRRAITCIAKPYHVTNLVTTPEPSRGEGDCTTPHRRIKQTARLC